MRDWMALRAKAGASRLTIRNGIAPVRAALSEAVEDGLLRDNPAALPRSRGGRSAVPGKPPKAIVPPEHETVGKTIAAAEGHFRLVLTLAASCGLRRGEIYALRWSDFSDDLRKLTVRRSNRSRMMVDPKTESSGREVPVFPTVRKALLEHKIASAFKAPDALVFADALGRPLNPGSTVTQELAAAFKRAGLSEKTFRLHDLRHYAVSRLIAAGAPVTQVSRVAGHKSPDITLRIYSHLFDGDVSRVADRYDPLVAEVG